MAQNKSSQTDRIDIHSQLHIIAIDTECINTVQLALDEYQREHSERLAQEEDDDRAAFIQDQLDRAERFSNALSTFDGGEITITNDESEVVHPALAQAYNLPDSVRRAVMKELEVVTNNLFLQHSENVGFERTMDWVTNDADDPLAEMPDLYVNKGGPNERH